MTVETQSEPHVQDQMGRLISKHFECSEGRIELHKRLDRGWFSKTGEGAYIPEER